MQIDGVLAAWLRGDFGVGVFLCAFDLLAFLMAVSLCLASVSGVASASWLGALAVSALSLFVLENSVC